jgi:pilus assembly protein CpaB
MKPKTLILMLVAVACGLVAAFLAANYSPQAGTAPGKQVLVTAVDLPPGAVFSDPKMLALKAYSEDQLPVKYFQNFEDVRGKTIARAMDKNTVLTPNDLSMAESLFPKTLPAGYRAATVRVTVESAQAGFVLPGSYVDLLCTLPDPNDARKSLTKTFMQNVMVLAVNTLKDVPKEGGGVIPTAQTVTFAIKPEDVERLESAKNRGQLAMSLRRPGEKETVETKGVTNPFMAADAAKGGADGTGDKTQTVKVWVAEETIKPLTDISKEAAERAFKLVSYPQALAHNALTEKDSLVGRVQHLVPAGFPITKEHYETIGGTAPVGPGGKRGLITVMTVIEGTKVPQEFVFENGRTRRTEDREGLPEPDQRPKGKGSEGPSEN